VGLYHAADDSNRIFVLEQAGTIYVFANEENVDSKDVFLDIKSRILYGGEQGLLGLAFHPNYRTNGQFYVNYVAGSPRRTVISRFTVSDTNSNEADAGSEFVLLEISQPYANHNGGQIAFGPDGNLYIAMGDGGSAGDPGNNAQDRSSLLGKILRIDVDSGLPYAVPSDNPFVGNTDGYREEIYAYGLRNPWRFSFDPVTGRLWAADVGQNSWEEIDVIEKGKNYGWNIMEGNHSYEGGEITGDLELPIFEYGHDEGNSITGGYIYRGSSLTGIVGNYIYGDYITGKIWSLEYGSDLVAVNNTLLIDTSLQIASFGVDEENELYICAFDGNIYKLKEVA
jgi:glucose/arabinose dehydrogenase